MLYWWTGNKTYSVKYTILIDHYNKIRLSNILSQSLPSLVFLFANQLVSKHMTIQAYVSAGFSTYLLIDFGWLVLYEVYINKTSLDMIPLQVPYLGALELKTMENGEQKVWLSSQYEKFMETMAERKKRDQLEMAVISPMTQGLVRARPLQVKENSFTPESESQLEEKVNLMVDNRLNPKMKTFAERLRNVESFVGQQNPLLGRDGNDENDTEATEEIT